MILQLDRAWYHIFDTETLNIGRHRQWSNVGFFIIEIQNLYFEQAPKQN